MSHTTLTYTRDAAACATFGGRTAEAVGGIGRAKITPPKGRKWLIFRPFGAIAARGPRGASASPTVGDAGAPHCVCTEYNLIFIFNF